MADFSEAIMLVMQNEGGYVNDPDDRGGETKYGISKRSYPDLDIKNLEFSEAQEIYRRDFWNKLSLNDIDQQLLAEQVFDFGVNAGPKRAAHCLQDAYNLLSHYKGLKTDGIVGPQTTKAVNGLKYQSDLLALYKVLRGAYYLSIVRYDLPQQKYFRGWLRRVGIR